MTKAKSTTSAAHSRRRRKQRSAISKVLTTERVMIGGAILVTVVILGAIIANSVGRQSPDIDMAAIPDNSESFSIQESEHISRGQIHPAYNSNPPTSGWHYGQDVDLRVYTDSIEDEMIVHNLEHGHVWLSYRDDDDTEALEILRQIQRQYPSHVLVTHRPENDSRIAASAWGRLLVTDELDAEELQAFVVRHRSRAPENIPG